MFRKLVSRIPFSPQLESSLKEYTRSLKQHSHLRFLGLGFLVAAISLQLFLIFNATLLTVDSKQSASQVSQRHAPPSDFIEKKLQLRKLSGESASAPVQPGDMIEYTLESTNTSTQPIKLPMVIDATNILQYANLIDATGGELTASTQLVWDAGVVPAGATVQRTLLVQMKSPLPQGLTKTPITLTYGNEAVLKPATAPEISLQQFTPKLPSLSVSTQLALSGCLLAIVLFLSLRSRLLVKETLLVGKLFQSAHSSSQTATTPAAFTPADQKHSFNTVMAQVRSHLSRTERKMSYFIHIPLVEKLSDFIGNLFLTPLGVLLGGGLATLGLASYLLVSHTAALQVTGSEMYVLFLVGCVLGAVFELLNNLRRQLTA